MQDITLAGELKDEIELIMHGDLVAKSSAAEVLKRDHLERTVDAVIVQLGGVGERYF